MQNLEERAKKSVLSKLVDTKTKWFNWKTGPLFGTGAGIVVYYINREYGFEPAFFAGLKQATYICAIGGLNSKICETLAKEIKNTALSLTSFTVLPASFAFLTNYLVHELGGTPEALDSSTWQIPINMALFGIFGYRWHKQGKQYQKR